METEKRPPKKFSITIDESKPHLYDLYNKEPKRAAEVVGLFVQLMEEACSTEQSGIAWIDLPQLFDSRNLSLADLIKGVLHGALDVKQIDPENFDVWGEELHPLSMLSPRPNYLSMETINYDWRGHFRLPNDAKVNQQTIEDIFRKLLRYYKYVDVEQLAKALINNQVKTYEGLGERNIENLPFVPALRFQKFAFGDLHVGKFFDHIGFFDCGNWVDGDSLHCPACKREDITSVGTYKVCKSCNAGFREGSL